MKASASNIDIKQLLALLSQMNLKYELCNISIDEERNRISIIAIKSSQKEGEEHEETDLSSLDGMSPEELI